MLFIGTQFSNLYTVSLSVHLYLCTMIYNFYLLMHAKSTELAGSYLEQRQKECAVKLAAEEAALRTSIEATHDTALKSLHRDISREQTKLSLLQREASSKG